jgi:hypothetical protein
MRRVSLSASGEGGREDAQVAGLKTLLQRKNAELEALKAKADEVRLAHLVQGGPLGEDR